MNALTTSRIPYQALGVFLIFFLLGPWVQLSSLSLIPGDVGDPRLNNYFLENTYQFFRGESPSLWHLQFFYPSPYVLGFSDNLFGSAPVYLFFRFVGNDTMTAFQLWFLVGYALNFSGAYYALRKLGASEVAASFGAAVFSFALPTTAHAGHAQLHYRFASPLAIVFFFEFLQRGSWRALAVSGGWLAWQFYCGIYNGFFTLFFITCAALWFFAEQFLSSERRKETIERFRSDWCRRSMTEKTVITSSLAGILASMIVLFYPYMQVVKIYGAKRDWYEIWIGLPRPQSYFLTSASHIWTPMLKYLANGRQIPHEHQMFVGAVPACVALLGLWIHLRQKNKSIAYLMTAAPIMMIILTVSVSGYSLWYLFHKLPLASAIRAMTRFDQIILFPLGYFAAAAIDRVRQVKYSHVILTTLFIIVLAECTWVDMQRSSKQSWQDRIIAAREMLPANLSEDSILLMAQRNGPFYADELDAMWIAFEKNLRTLNGYSGMSPPGFKLYSVSDCQEAISKAHSLLQDEQAVKNVVLIGFSGCTAISGSQSR